MAAFLDTPRSEMTKEADAQGIVLYARQNDISIYYIKEIATYSAVALRGHWPWRQLLDWWGGLDGGTKSAIMAGAGYYFQNLSGDLAWLAGFEYARFKGYPRPTQGGEIKEYLRRWDASLDRKILDKDKSWLSSFVADILTAPTKLVTDAIDNIANTDLNNELAKANDIISGMGDDLLKNADTKDVAIAAAAAYTGGASAALLATVGGAGAVDNLSLGGIDVNDLSGLADMFKTPNQAVTEQAAQTATVAANLAGTTAGTTRQPTDWLDALIMRIAQLLGVSA